MTAERENDTQWLMRHNVPQLFEGMVRGLISARPEDPLTYLLQYNEDQLDERRKDAEAKQAAEAEAEAKAEAEAEAEAAAAQAETVPAEAAQDADTATTESGSQYCYVVRHGHRIDNFVEDWTEKAEKPYDPPLTEEGKEAALALGKEFLAMPEDVRPTAIIASPFTRCLETAAGIAKGLGLTSMQANRQLGEIHDPRVMKISTAPELEPLPTEVDGVAITGLEGAQPPFPEERSAAMVRYAEAFNDVPKGVSQHVVLVTHGEAVGEAISSLCPELTVFETPYCSYAVRQRKRPAGLWSLLKETNGMVQWMDDS